MSVQAGPVSPEPAPEAPVTTSPRRAGPGRSRPRRRTRPAWPPPSRSPADLAPAVPDPAVIAEPPAPAGEALPVPNYDQLSVASLRARLRVLDATQVQVLLDYEKAHEGLAVITMFERRLTKLSEGS